MSNVLFCMLKIGVPFLSHGIFSPIIVKLHKSIAMCIVIRVLMQNEYHWNRNPENVIFENGLKNVQAYAR